MSDRSSDDMTDKNVVAPQNSPDETRLAAIETALGKLLERTKNRNDYRYFKSDLAREKYSSARHLVKSASEGLSAFGNP